MQFSTIFVSLLVAVSAAPHVHNAHQNRLVRRRAGPLLHEDLIALYNAGQVAATSTESATSASETEEASGHGPYAAGEAHGGNPAASQVISEVSATASAAVATGTSDSSTDSSSDWVPAAASRNTTIYSHSYSSGSTDETNDSTVSQASLATVVTGKSSTGLPGWAIAVTVIMILVSLGSVAALIYFKFHKTSATSNESSEKSQKPSKKEPEDALSSYKAFWEMKRRSAGSFISADASPEALATERALSRPVSHSSNITLPLYEESDVRGLGIGLAVSSPVNTPLNEEAPPRGLLYQ